MKIKCFIAFIMLIISSNTFSEKREKDLLGLINLEIKTIENVKKKGEQLNYRLFELYSEKTKIMRRAESELMIKDQATGKKIHKATYYKESQAVFNHAFKFAHEFLKTFPKSRYLSAVYYGLASNQIEVQNTVEADQKVLIEWLSLAVKKAVSDEKKYLAQVKLAEVYYTIKDYDLAIKTYKPVIENSEDKWYTKNLYNLSWCYFQTKNYGKSVELAKLAFLKSKNKRYENVSDQAMDALDYFYVFAKTPEAAIAFHIKYNQDQKSKMEHFIKLLDLSQKFISTEVALQTEKPARNYCQVQKDYACLFNMSAFKLMVYKDGKRYDEHATTVRSALLEYKSLQTLKITVDDTVLSSVINNIGETASTFQQLAYKSHYAFRDNREETYKTIVDYYNALKLFNPSFHHEYAFLQGELSYKEEKFENASKFYVESLEKLDPQKKLVDFSNKLFKSMLSLSNENRFNNKVFFEKTHLAYINFYDKQESTIPIYQALFKYYQSEKKYQQSEDLLTSFHQKMPNLIDVQREMTKVIVNNYITLKNIDKVNFWILHLKKGFLSFDKKFIDQNVVILAQLLFENAQKREVKGDYAGAIKEYEAIKDNKDYPAEVRADSLYNIAINYLSLKDPEKSFDSLKESLRMKTRKEVLKKIPDLQSIAREYVVLQSLPSASSVYKFLFKNYCADLSNTDALFLTYAQVEIAQDRLTMFKDASDFKKCVFNDQSLKVARSIYIDWLMRNKKYMELADLHAKPEYRLHFNDIFHEFYSLYWRFEEKSHDKEFLLLKEQLEKFYKFTFNNLSEESRIKYAAIQSWDNVSKSLLSYESETKKKGVVKGDIAYLQPILESELEKLMTLKEEKLAAVEKIQDPNLYQAELYSLTMRFQTANDWIGSWVCKSKKPEESKQWDDVKVQVQKGLGDQIQSFKDALSAVIAKGALPLASLQKVRGDAQFNPYLYEAYNQTPFFIRHRALSSVGGKQ